jgi:Flp pilus assembly protein TadD
MLWIIFPLLLVPSCTLPKIIILEDKLTAEQHNDLGYVYETKGMDDLAGKEYNLALKKRGDWITPMFNMGNLFFRKGDYSTSELYFRKVLKIDPANADAMNNLANVLLMQRHCQEANRMVDQAIKSSRKAEYLDTREKIVEKQHGVYCID